MTIQNGASLQPLVDQLPPGSTLTLPDGVYGGPLTLPKAITIQAVGGVRRGVRATSAGVILITPDGLLIPGADVTFAGVHLACSNPLKNIVNWTGSRLALHGCVVLGTPSGQRRGLALNGDTFEILDSTIDDCWAATSEAQAVAGWDGVCFGTIDNSYLGGSAQSLMFGGGDALTASRVPASIRVTRSDLVKHPAWLRAGYVVKTGLELKSCVSFELSDSTVDGAGTSAGQGGYLFVFKALNQDGHAPWSTVQNVLIERVTAKRGAGCASFVAKDGPNPAVPLGNVTLRDVAFTDIDPAQYPGSPGRGFTFIGAVTDITLENVTVQAQNMAASMYFIGPPPVRLVLRNVQLPPSLYGVKIDAGPSLKTPAEITAGLKAWAPGAIVENITIV